LGGNWLRGKGGNGHGCIPRQWHVGLQIGVGCITGIPTVLSNRRVVIMNMFTKNTMYRGELSHVTYMQDIMEGGWVTFLRPHGRRGGALLRPHGGWGLYQDLMEGGWEGFIKT